MKRFRIAVAAVLSAVLLVAVAAVAAPPPGKGNKHGKPAGSAPAAPTAPTAGAAEYQYGSGGKQYGKHRVAICHKGHTIRVAQPAVKAHLRHGDTLGPC
ncbi:MAG TPA: hypothetical protein VGJ77_16995 [Gaiellaceae bacterium]|jgi:hypothetical protein